MRAREAACRRAPSSPPAAAVMQPTGYKAGDTVVAKFEGIGELTLNIAADSKL